MSLPPPLWFFLGGVNKLSWLGMGGRGGKHDSEHFALFFGSKVKRSILRLGEQTELVVASGPTARLQIEHQC